MLRPSPITENCPVCHIKNRDKLWMLLAFVSSKEFKTLITLARKIETRKHFFNYNKSKKRGK